MLGKKAKCIYNSDDDDDDDGGDKRRILYQLTLA